MSIAKLRNLRSQWFPASPNFTGNHFPSQKNNVFIVTEGNSDVGYELCKFLDATGAPIHDGKAKIKTCLRCGFLLMEKLNIYKI